MALINRLMAIEAFLLDRALSYHASFGTQAQVEIRGWTSCRLFRLGLAFPIPNPLPDDLAFENENMNII